MTHTSCCAGPLAVAFGNVRPALAMRCSHVLRMRRRVARTVSVAHECSELEAIIMRNFTPALPGLVRRNNVVETLA